MRTQIDFLLRRALREAGRYSPTGATPADAAPREEADDGTA